MNDENEIVKQYRPLVYKWACKYRRFCNRKTLEFNDLISFANQGLVYAIRKFDESKSVKFITFATVCVKFYLKTILRHAYRSNRFCPTEEHSIHGMIKYRDEGLMKSIAIIEPSYTKLLEQEEKDLAFNIAKRLKKELPSKHWNYLKEYYFDGKDQGVISKEVGITPACVGKRRHKALSLARELLGISL